jgi:hypothetical protein
VGEWGSEGLRALVRTIRGVVSALVDAALRESQSQSQYQSHSQIEIEICE